MQKNNLLFLVELLWWGITAVIGLLVYWPIAQSGTIWPFWVTNTVFIISLVTLWRYVFLLDHTFIGKQQITKAVVMIALFPLAFYLIGELNGFMTYIEEKTWEPITGHLLHPKNRPMESFLWNETLFFGAGSIIGTPVLFVRLFSSIWKQYNSEKRKNYQNYQPIERP